MDKKLNKINFNPKIVAVKLFCMRMIITHEMKMKNLKITSLAVLSGVFLLQGCGGGGNDDHYQGVDEVSAVELAQIAAGIQAAKTSFDVVLYDGQAVIEETIGSGQAGKTIDCRSGNFSVTENSKTAYKGDGLLINKDCLTNTSKWNGAIELECLDANCEKSITTATGAVWGDRNSKIDLIANGEMLSDAVTDGFKGTMTLDINGRKTGFDFADVGLIQKYNNNGFSDGFGQLKIVGGQANRCINGTYGYEVTSMLSTEKNSLRVVGGKMQILDHKNRDLGEVKFEYDGAVSVYTRDGRTEFFTASEFESYCGLSEAYRFSAY